MIEVWTIFLAISTLTGLTLILTGLSVMSWLVIRFTDVFADLDQELWQKILVWLGSVVGIFSLATAAINMVIPYSPQLPSNWDPNVNTDVVSILILIIAGILLVLRPIKDVRWAALAGLFTGALMFAGIAFFWGYENVLNTWVAVIVILAMFGVYLTLKFVEDIYKVIGDLLTFPPVTVVLGLIAILQGILVLFDFSLLMLVPL